MPGRLIAPVVGERGANLPLDLFQHRSKQVALGRGGRVGGEMVL